MVIAGDCCSEEAAYFEGVPAVSRRRMGSPELLLITASFTSLRRVEEEGLTAGQWERLWRKVLPIQAVKPVCQREVPRWRSGRQPEEPRTARCFAWAVATVENSKMLFFNFETEKGIRFQMPLTKMRIHWEAGPRTFESMQEAAKELHRRGITVETPGRGAARTGSGSSGRCRGNLPGTQKTRLRESRKNYKIFKESDGLKGM
ncbi:unnamed protein product [Merluccius merluccius]